MGKALLKLVASGPPNVDICYGSSSAPGIYSFVAEPKNHKLTSTCYFSRIDTAMLEQSFSTPQTRNYHVVKYNGLRLVYDMALSFLKSV